jgi:hypothetical protein
MRAIYGSWLILAGCAFQTQMHEAERAVGLRDWKTAAFAYQEACELRPRHEEACELAHKIGRRATEDAVDAAREACLAKNFDACLRELQPARELSPGDPGVAQVLDEAGQLRLAQCDVQRAHSVDAALEAVACVQEPRQRIGTDAYAQEVAKVETNAANAFIREMVKYKGNPAAQWVLASVAQCFEANGNRALMVNELGHEFLDRASIHLEPAIGMAGRATPPPAFEGTCEAVAADFEGTTCTKAYKTNETLRVELRTALGTTRHQVTPETRSVRYVARVEQRPNPEYAAAVAARRDSSAAFHDYEPTYVEASRACVEATTAWQQTSCSGCSEAIAKDEACAKADSARTIYDRRLAELEAAKRLVETTPPMVDVPIYADHVYTIHHHRWSADWKIETRGAAALGGVFTVTDDENRGFPPAKIDDDPLRPPATDHFEQALAAAVQQHFREQVRADLQRRAAEQRARCNDPRPDWRGPTLACRVEADLWDPNVRVSSSPFTAGIQCQKSR